MNCKHSMRVTSVIKMKLSGKREYFKGKGRKTEFPVGQVIQTLN